MSLAFDIASIDAISRTRSLTDKESILLASLIRAEQILARSPNRRPRGRAKSAGAVA
jgi:hypothetical protein